MGKTAQNLRDKLGHLKKITNSVSTEIQQEQQRYAISHSGNDNKISNSDDLDNYGRNTEETIETAILSQWGINEYTAGQERPEMPISVPREDEQFYVDIRNTAQPTFNLLKESLGNWDNKDSSTLTKKILNARQIKALEKAHSFIRITNKHDLSFFLLPI